MRKSIGLLAVLVGAVLLSSSLHANFTLMDMAKDSMFIARGEFTSLERTIQGDRLTLRCDRILKGELNVGAQVILEPFERLQADEALGRDVIVCFNLMNGKHYFVNHPFGDRSFIFEESDAASNGLDQNETALRNLIAINKPYQKEILEQLRMRLERGIGFMGQFDSELIEAWKQELLTQASWAGTVAARDAAKAIVEHSLIKDSVTVSDLEQVGKLVPVSQVGSIERSYMLEAIRNQQSAHPDFETLVSMVREETWQACVGKLSNLFLPLEREMVLGAIGELAVDRNNTERSRVNALQILQALRDTDGLHFVHQAIEAELEAADPAKMVVRRAFMALRDTPDESNVEFLTSILEHDYISESWELTQRAWVAYAVVDSDETNEVIRNEHRTAQSKKARRFFQKMLPQNKIVRKILIIHRED